MSSIQRYEFSASKVHVLCTFCIVYSHNLIEFCECIFTLKFVCEAEYLPINFCLIYILKSIQTDAFKLSTCGLGLNGGQTSV